VESISELASEVFDPRRRSALPVKVCEVLAKSPAMSWSMKPVVAPFSRFSRKLLPSVSRSSMKRP